jgi:hypothetical protein
MRWAVVLPLGPAPGGTESRWPAGLGGGMETTPTPRGRVLPNAAAADYTPHRVVRAHTERAPAQRHLPMRPSGLEPPRAVKLTRPSTRRTARRWVQPVPNRPFCGLSRTRWTYRTIWMLSRCCHGSEHGIETPPVALLSSQHEGARWGGAATCVRWPRSVHVPSSLRGAGRESTDHAGDAAATSTETTRFGAASADCAAASRASRSRS